MSEENFDIRHLLSAERTGYANERTFLSYIRTSLTLLITGITFLGFTTSIFLTVIAWVFIPTGIVILITGTFYFNKRRKRIRKEKEIINRSLH